MAKEEKSIKIVIGGTHFARLIPEHAEVLEGLEPNRNEWLNNMCLRDFGFELKTKDDILKLRDLMLERGYENTSDWVREKYRQRLHQEAAKQAYYHDYPTKPIGGSNPYYCCSYCGVSDPEINGRLEGHSETCEYRIHKEKEIGIR